MVTRVLGTAAVILAATVALLGALVLLAIIGAGMVLNIYLGD